MIRRKFIKYFSGLSIGFLQNSLLRVLYAAEEYTNSTNLTFIDQSNKKHSLPVVNKYERLYVSLKEFANAAGFGIFTNPEKRKAVLYIQDTKIKFTAENPFVIINNEQNVQIFYKPFWKEGEIWAPVPELISLISDYSAIKLNLNSKTSAISIVRKDINITRVNVITKQNGVMVEFFATKKFTERDLHTKKVNGWFYLEIIGGKLDVKVVNRKINNELISEIQALQFKEMASVAFKLKNEVVEKQLSEQENSNNIFLSLLTNKRMEKDLKAKEEMQKQRQKWMIDTIVIDPGHGGKDPGAVGYGKVKEKDIVLPVALKLGKALQNKLEDVKIVYTRKTDVFIPLWKRTRIANQANGKLFISLHCNSNRNSKIRGFETYFLSAEQDERAKDAVMKENQSINFEEVADKKRYEGVNFVLATLAQNAFIKQSRYLASTVQKKMALKLQPEGMKDRGVKQGPFWVMVGATMPNILVEMGFISNKYESKLLRQKSIQQKLVDSICDGIIKYKTDFESTI